MSTTRPVANGHYHLLAYGTGTSVTPRFLHHPDTSNSRVLCAEEPLKTEWAVLYEGIRPPGYFVWRHPLLGRLLDHNRENDTAIIWNQNPENNRSNQTWDIRRHSLPTPEDPDNYYFTLSPLSGPNAGYLTRGDQIPGAGPRRWEINIRPGTGDNGSPGPDQRWIFLYIPSSSS